MDLVAAIAQAMDHTAAGFHLFEAQLGMGVDIVAQRYHRRGDVANAGQDAVVHGVVSLVGIYGLPHTVAATENQGDAATATTDKTRRNT